MKWLRQKSVVWLLCLLALSMLAGRAHADQRVDFQRIASQLDPGGEVFMVVSAGRWIDRHLLLIAQGRDGLPPGEPGEREIRDSVEQVRRFFNLQGVSAWRGWGASSVEQTAGQHSVKLFLSRDHADSSLPFWRGLFGWQPRRLLSLDFVPASFSMVAASTMDTARLWRFIGDAATDIGTADSQRQFQQGTEWLTQRLGLSPDVLFESLRDEVLLAIRWNHEEMLSFPVKADVEISLPSPEFLMVIGTGEDVLLGVCKGLLSRWGLDLRQTEVAGTSVFESDDSIPDWPIRWKPAFASLPGFFVFGSSADVVKEALQAYRHRNGLITRPVFKDAFQGLSMVNNGVFYMDAESSNLLRHWQQSLSARDGVDVIDPMRSAQNRIYNAFVSLGAADMKAAFVLQNWRNGIMVMGSSGVGGDVILQRTAAAWLRFRDTIVNRLQISVTFEE